MYQTMEMYLPRKKKVPNRFLPNTHRVLDGRYADARLVENKINSSPVFPKPHQDPRLQDRHNMPHALNIKYIQGNVRFVNEPIAFIQTANTNNKQAEWWPTEQQAFAPHKPAYDRSTTQRSDFDEEIYSGLQTRRGYALKTAPARGIVPLASPRNETRIPKLLQEEMSFEHRHDPRSACKEPIRGKVLGRFVWREIKPDSGSAIPKESIVLPNAKVSHALEKPPTD